MSAMYYLSRGPTPEGPFEEARLVQMIQSGELTHGGVCLVGQSQWVGIDSIPVLAQALATRAAGPPPQPVAPTIPENYPAAAQNYGAPAQPQYGAAPQIGAGYGPPPGAAQGGPGVGPTQPDYGPGPGYAPQGVPARANPNAAFPGAQPAAKKSKLGLILGLVAGGGVLLIGGIALAVYLVFFSSGGARKISQVVPRDCELLIDVPSVRKGVLDLHDVQFLDTSLRDDKQVLEQAADSLVKSFDLSQSDALSLLNAAETAGISARKLESKPEVVVALGMRSAGPVDALLKSSRFTAAGSIGKAGQRYTLARKQLAAGTQDVVVKGLSEAQIRATDSEQLVWFASQKVLALGDSALVNDVAQVVESGAASIEQNPAYQAAQKDFDKGARLTAFVDPGALSNVTDPKVRQLVDGYFTPSGPLTSSFRVNSAGFINSITGHITGTKLPHDDAYSAPQALNLSDKLPAETFAYAAFSTSTKLTGAEIEKLLLDQLSTVDARTHNQAEQGIREFEQLLGVSTAKLIDGIGGQGVLGIAASPGTTFEQLSSEQIAASHVNVTYVQELKDASEYKKLTAALKARILPGAREVLVTPEGDGFALTPRGTPLPVSLRVKFLDKYLFITAGSNALCDRAEAAFSKGTSTLKDDAAHKSALGALPDTSHVRLWIDTGRLLDTLSKNPLVKARMAESGISLDKITLAGSSRVTSALSLRSEVKLDVWTFRADALNLQAFAPLGAGAAALAGGLPMLRAL